MDTREKILPVSSLPAVLSSGEWTIVVGSFDPLTAAQARRIASLYTPGTKLLVVVVSDEDSLLDAGARAALVAALREVACVIVADDDSWRSALPSTPRIRLVEDPEGERRRSAEFVRFVIDRYDSAQTAR